MPIELARVEEIFAEALCKTDAAARAGYLDDACGGDAELRERVDALLAAHDATGNFLKLPDTDGATSLFVPVSEGPKSKIGRYKLLEQIGEGGFGVVFMAEQEEPVRRRVALKIIKLGMDTRQVVARFEAERQALAMMDHPSVAKVLDGGATETGRPYFVMELVKGVPITEYCDQHKLSIPKRLELFGQVCQAVQHAHQKGLIHRDIKPSNVLVSTQDDRPVAKVIDFGVAKAMQSRLTEKTLFTEFQQLVGTPAYMSPEQAAGSLDIDTRSDVYALGVLLYELLAGTPPFDPKELRSKAFAEMQRIIREVEPPMPSTRLSSLSRSGEPSRTNEHPLAPGERAGVRASSDLASIAAHRAIDPRKLAAMVRGELDWIVMKALEKDRQRRYQTANGLAGDIDRYLHDEPVQACPPSAMYRFRKFARRNKAALFVASAAVAMLLVLVTGLAISNRLIAAQRAQAEAERQRAEENLLRARVAQAGFYVNLSKILASEGRFADSATISRKVLEIDPLNAIAYNNLGTSLLNQGKLEEAVVVLRKAIEVNPKDPHAYGALGLSLARLGKLDDAIAAYRTAIELQPNNGKVYTNLGAALFAQGKSDEAAAAYRKAIEFAPEVYEPYSNLGSMLRERGQLDEAVAIYRKAIEVNPYRSMPYIGLGTALRYQGKLEEAMAAYYKAIERQPNDADLLNSCAWNILNVSQSRAQFGAPSGGVGGEGRGVGAARGELLEHAWRGPLSRGRRPERRRCTKEIHRAAKWGRLFGLALPGNGQLAA